jgi:formyltetrahydrofolate-dependent phosphoribosylglycinamide formyltransferase
LLWPVSVLLISIPLGQFNFFKKYIRKLFRRMSGQTTKKQRIAIFASGAGSNAQKIMEHFAGHASIEVRVVVCNKPGAGVIDIAKRFDIPVLMIEKENFFRGDNYIRELRSYKTDWIVLAGFLWKVPVPVIQAFPNHIINIHPALLPKYGGKGMYGKHVHEAVRLANDTETGISIHFVDGLYDHGKIILQEKCVVTADDDADAIAQKVHALEHEFFAKTIEEVILSLPQRYTK